MIEPLTQPQKNALDYIKTFKAMHGGISPTRKEVAQAMGYRSDNAAQCVIDALARKGAIKLHKGMARGISLI